MGAGRARPGRHQRPYVLAVDHAVGGRQCPGERGERGVEVHGRGEFGAGLSGGDTAWGPHDARHAHAAFVRGALAGPQGQGASAVRALAEPRAVVGQEHDDRVPVQAEGLQRVDDLPAGPVDALDDVAVEPAGRLAPEPLRHEQRHVRHGVGQVEEEGLVPVGGDERQGLAGVALGEAGLVGGVLEDLLVAQQDRAAAPVGSLRGHVVAVGDAEVGIEAVARRQEGRDAPEVPLADAAGGVAPGLEQFGDRDLVGVQPRPRPRKEHPAVQTHAARVASGQQGRPRRRADGRGYVKVRELRPLGRQAVQAGRLDLLGAEAAEVGVALVVGEDEDEVRRAAVRAGLGGAGPGAQPAQRGCGAEAAQEAPAAVLVVYRHDAMRCHGAGLLLPAAAPRRRAGPAEVTTRTRRASAGRRPRPWRSSAPCSGRRSRRPSAARPAGRR